MLSQKNVCKKPHYFIIFRWSRVLKLVASSKDKSQQEILKKLITAKILQEKEIQEILQGNYNECFIYFQLIQ